MRIGAACCPALPAPPSVSHMPPISRPPPSCIYALLRLGIYIVHVPSTIDRAGGWMDHPVANRHHDRTSRSSIHDLCTGSDARASQPVLQRFKCKSLPASRVKNMERGEGQKCLHCNGEGVFRPPRAHARRQTRPNLNGPCRRPAAQRQNKQENLFDCTLPEARRPQLVSYFKPRGSDQFLAFKQARRCCPCPVSLSSDRQQQDSRACSAFLPCALPRPKASASLVSSAAPPPPPLPLPETRASRHGDLGSDRPVAATHYT
jgi:hypothetical protein